MNFYWLNPSVALLIIRAYLAFCKVSDNQQVLWEELTGNIDSQKLATRIQSLSQKVPVGVFVLAVVFFGVILLFAAKTTTTRGRKKKKKKKKKSSMATWTDLPREIVLHMAAVLPPRDACILGATCSQTYDAIADPHLWRRFFVRDFARRYESGLAAQPWPHAVHPEDPWPEAALDLWAGTDAVERMPPRCRPVPDLPAPFAHAFAVGKDWLWLYRAHAVASSAVRRCAPPRPLSNTFVWIGDSVDGKFRGYNVKVWFGFGVDEVKIAGWEEATHGETEAKGWVVRCDRDETVHKTRGRNQGNFSAVWNRYTGGRSWMGSMQRSDGRQGEQADERSVKAIECVDGTIAGPIQCGWFHGIVRSSFSNGDILVSRYDHGAFIKGVEFICSPTCPRPEYAGLVIDGCRWRRTSVWASRYTFEVVMPDDDSDHARLFWDYVRDGLVGWGPEIRHAVLDAIAPRL